MFCNPFLKGASTQKRCSVCNRILLDSGVCIEGCQPTEVAPPPIQTPTQAEDPRVSKPAPMEHPVFSEEQRRQAAANMMNRIRAASYGGDVEPTTTERGPASPPEIRLATAEAADSDHGAAAGATATQEV